MSWDADLLDAQGHSIGEWNYTHNMNTAIAAAIEARGGTTIEQCAGPLGPAIGAKWWVRLDGMSGPAGASFLHEIICEIESDPEHYRRYEPNNGWGSVETLLQVLTEMRNSVPEYPTTWRTCG